MLNCIKTGAKAWGRSLGVLARSPLYALVLAAIAGLWCLAGYQWLWLSESSIWVLALALLWILALFVVALALVAGTVRSVSASSVGAENRLRLRWILSFEKQRLLRALLAAVVGIVLLLLLCTLFGWLNRNALSAASFLTFHLQRPVSYKVIGKIFWVIEALIWTLFAGFLMAWLLALSNPRQTGAPQSKRQPLASGFCFSVYLTTLLSAIVFGGLAWLLATWHPLVKAGAWDYAQLIARNGLALTLLTLGWLFWALALAILTLAPVTDSSDSPPAS